MFLWCWCILQPNPFQLFILLTMSIPSPNLILFEHCPSTGHAPVLPFILQVQLLNLLSCQFLHVGWQQDAMICKLWDLWGWSEGHSKTNEKNNSILSDLLASSFCYKLAYCSEEGFHLNIVSPPSVFHCKWLKLAGWGSPEARPRWYWKETGFLPSVSRAAAPSPQTNP